MKHVCVGAALYYGIAALADVCVRVYMITICAVLCDLCAPAGGAGAPRERRPTGACVYITECTY